MLVLKSSQSNLQQQQTHLVSQDSAMGNITVSDIDLKGSYVRLSNTSNKIWSSDHSDRNNPPTDLVWQNQKSWGTGEELLVTVYNNTGEVSHYLTFKTLINTVYGQKFVDRCWNTDVHLQQSIHVIADFWIFFNVFNYSTFCIIGNSM
ncbi:hypothetical protein ABVT39_023523 [Epinephelus coioides]